MTQPQVVQTAAAFVEALAVIEKICQADEARQFAGENHNSVRMG
jgi:hypothetical protein